MTKFERGDVVIVDLGMMAKVRPCVVVSVREQAAETWWCKPFHASQLAETHCLG